jgi:hypothetical protein
MNKVNIISAVSFEDGRVDSYFSDKSVISINKSTLTYFSPAAVKTQISLGSIDSCTSDIAGKLNEFLEIYNTYNDVPLLLPMLWEKP